MKLANRFRKFYPVVIDIETGGFDARKNPILELAAVFLKMNEVGLLEINDRIHFHVNAFEGSILDPDSLEFTGIKPENPFRFAVSEKEALEEMFAKIHANIKEESCERAVMVAHNATFDQGFLKAATARCKLQNDPFHRFTTFDTASLAGLAYGQTVLAKAVKAAGMNYDKESAHSAKYDAEITAELFCKIVNKWEQVGGYKK